MTEPTTKRGREFLSWWQGRHHITVTLEYVDVMVELIEREAVAQERARLRAVVEGLPNPWDEGAEFVTEFSNAFGFEKNAFGFEKGRAAVLRLLDPEAEGGTE